MISIARVLNFCGNKNAKLTFLHHAMSYTSSRIQSNDAADNKDFNSILADPEILKLSNSFDQPVAIPLNLAVPLGLSTASKKEILQHKIHKTIANFQMHKCDTGSSQVQIAVLSDKITNLARHLASNKQDMVTARSYRGLIQRRRDLMKYLKRYNFETYKATVKVLGLEKEDKRISNFRS